MIFDSKTFVNISPLSRADDLQAQLLGVWAWNTPNSKYSTGRCLQTSITEGSLMSRLQWDTEKILIC